MVATIASAILQLIGTLVPLAIQAMQASKEQHDQIAADAIKAASDFQAEVARLASTLKANDATADKALDARFSGP